MLLKFAYQDFIDDRKFKKAKPISGVIIVTKENFNMVKGFDERFAGWGKEDNAFKDAMNTVCGPYKWPEATSIYHLWHPKVGSRGNPNYHKNVNLYKRYNNNRGNLEEMKKLIMERAQNREFLWIDERLSLNDKPIL
ncbi:hypothetical protein F7731_22525 [Cytobacillus depressus]|uniref:Galactosyltransferase C-terminal domain-containing protein n=1 Tax=Cytobacillus depressus TaxID=1602942 RepID=A0A6L3V154_9BACI|nr:galactosyltransferase-related protein [Cytobacillus depressus]KAB2329365.1 hypothetical protein F7731_22525 [Cytobacillus depressus]